LHRDELIGAPFKNYFTDPERAEAGIRRVLSGNNVTDYELTVCARDGKETVVSFNATTFHDRDLKLQGVLVRCKVEHPPPAPAPRGKHSVGVFGWPDGRAKSQKEMFGEERLLEIIRREARREVMRSSGRS
jgi:hypothetical protein